jgi:hypothetical protein
MNSQRFLRAIALIDQANGEDPNLEMHQGQMVSRELLYSRRMSECLARFMPEAGEAAQLAARAQHLRRWKVPREDYPMNREGYLRWRSFLYGFQAEQAGQLLREAGYEDGLVDEVGRIIAKRGLKHDPDVQLIEDVACLVFLEHYFPAFAAIHDEDKLLGVIRKTWRKMSEAAHGQALRLDFPKALSDLLAKALSPQGQPAESAVDASPMAGPA